MKTENVIIIGAGPAGIATAIQLKRSGVTPLLLEKSHAGGLLVNANWVENYPGFPQGITGPDLVKLFNDQLGAVGATVDYEHVTKLDYEDDFIIATSKRHLKSRMVVIASGTRPRTIDVPPEAANRVFYEIAPIAELEGKHIAVIGAGDAAFDYSLNLSRRNQVTLLNRGQQCKCLPLLRERVKRNDAISYQDDTVIEKIGISSQELVLSGQNAQGGWELRADYAIFAIGRTAQLEFLTPRLNDASAGLEQSGLLYFVGDVKNGDDRQTSIAVGDGIRAAMEISRKVQELGLCES